MAGLEGGSRSHYVTKFSRIDEIRQLRGRNPTVNELRAIAELPISHPIHLNDTSEIGKRILQLLETSELERDVSLLEEAGRLLNEQTYKIPLHWQSSAPFSDHLNKTPGLECGNLSPSNASFTKATFTGTIDRQLGIDTTLGTGDVQTCSMSKRVAEPRHASTNSSDQLVLFAQQALEYQPVQSYQPFIASTSTSTNSNTWRNQQFQPPQRPSASASTATNPNDWLTQQTLKIQQVLPPPSQTSSPVTNSNNWLDKQVQRQLGAAQVTSSHQQVSPAQQIENASRQYHLFGPFHDHSNQLRAPQAPMTNYPSWQPAANQQPCAPTPAQTSNVPVPTQQALPLTAAQPSTMPIPSWEQYTPSATRHPTAPAASQQQHPSATVQAPNRPVLKQQRRTGSTAQMQQAGSDQCNNLATSNAKLSASITPDPSASSHHFQTFDSQPPKLILPPRCERCVKLKRSCDRQRPCQRCRDKGIEPEKCVHFSPETRKTGSTALKYTNSKILTKSQPKPSILEKPQQVRPRNWRNKRLSD